MTAITAQETQSTIVVPRVTVGLVRQAYVSARDAGVIDELSVHEGEMVQEGQVLAVLDNDEQVLTAQAAELNLKIAATRAEDTLAIDAARYQLQEAESLHNKQQIALQIAENEAVSDVAIKVAESQKNLADMELTRARKARESFKGAVSQTELDRLLASVRRFSLEMEQAQHEQKLLTMKPGMERASLEQQGRAIKRFERLLQQEEKAQVIAGITRQMQENQLALAKVKLEHRNIRAPFDGMVVSIDQEVGEWVETGTKVIRIIDLKTLQVEGFIEVSRARQSLTGRKVRIELAGNYEEVIVEGQITFVSPEVDSVNQRVRIRAEFNNPDLSVWPGFKGQMRIVQ